VGSPPGIHLLDYPTVLDARVVKAVFLFMNWLRPVPSQIFSECMSKEHISKCSISKWNTMWLVLKTKKKAKGIDIRAEEA
jgi:hypothetical protein